MSGFFSPEVIFPNSLMSAPAIKHDDELYQLLREETGLPVTIADNALHCVVLGSGRVLEELDRMRGVLFEE